jgi:acylpyruvate hydrolase
MRLATVEGTAGTRLHVWARGGYVDLATGSGDESLASLAGFLAGGPAAREAAEARRAEAGTAVADSVLGPAVPAPPRVFCLGLNYRAHAAEGGREAPSWPEIFVRSTSSLVGPFAPLVRPALTDRFDFEGELGVVIGRRARYVHAADALATVAGYVVVNDAAARDWQRAATQWTPGKNFDGTMPVGPELVTADEVDPSDLAITTTLNGTVMQAARTSEMLVSVGEAIEFLSSFTTLLPGDLIATGTPAGVGFARTPPVWLEPGDVVEVTIEGVGTIRNVVAEERHGPPAWRWRP